MRGDACKTGNKLTDRKEYYIMKKTRKLVSLVCALVMVFALVAPAGAVQQSQSKAEFSADAEIVEISDLIASQYIKYEAFIPPQQSTMCATTSGQAITSTDILKLCTPETADIIGGTTIIEYSSDDAFRFLPMLDSLKEIILLGNNLHVGYIASDGMEVALTYTSNGLVDKVIYDNIADIATYISADCQQQYLNLRNGHVYEMTEDKQKIIDTYVESGNIEGLKELDWVVVTEFEDETFLIEENIPNVATYQENISESMIDSGPEIQVISDGDYPKGFTNINDVYNDLIRNVPMYTAKEVLKTSFSCSALGKNVPVRVTESRNSYTKVRQNFLPFAASTSISVIATAMDLPTKVVTLILTGLSIVISAADTIQSAVTLYRSVHYSYLFVRSGYVYDETVYNDYVSVIQYSDKGEYVGGYDSPTKSVWQWTDSIVPNTYDHTATDIAQEAAEAYNWNVALNGFCSAYTPWGFTN